MLSEDQKTALKLACSGHNLVIVGQAGTGKTHVIQRIVIELGKAGKAVSVTGTTGLACMSYPAHMQPTTIHRWSGVGDGRHDKEEIVRLVGQDVGHEETRQRIRKADLLIIDEVSMLSCRTLCHIEVVCRKVRGSQYPFGGLQVLLCGDFMQLPPVPNSLYGDPGHYAFEWQYFSMTFPHTVELKEVIRQKEGSLVTLVNELEKGELSPISHQLILQLSRPFPYPTENVIKLFARNLDVDVHNHRCMQNLSTQEMRYDSLDNGDPHYLNKITALKTLVLRIGAPVILLANLSSVFVNGLQGQVVGFQRSGPLIHFKTINKSLEIGTHVFTVFDPVSQKVIAERRQVPVNPSFALTIHKSQGQTLQTLELDCTGIHSPGQLGVAVGRAVSLDGLRIINFKDKHVLRHPSKVSEFYFRPCKAPQETTACCKAFIHEEYEEETDMSECESDEEELSQNNVLDMDIFLSSITNNVELEPGINVHVMLQSLLSTTCQTPFQQDITNHVQQLMIGGTTTEFIKSQFTVLEALWRKSCIDSRPEKIGPKETTAFFTDFHAYISSDTYQMKVKALFNVEKLNEAMTHIAASLLVNIRQNIFASQAEKLKQAVNRPPRAAISEAGQGKIRYIGGWAVAKIRYENGKLARRRVNVPDSEKAYQKVQILDEVIVSESELISSSQYMSTLEETSRKQNLRHGLLNITDASYEFFSKLTDEIQLVTSLETLNMFGSDLYQHSLQSVTANEELYGLWVSLFKSVPELSAHAEVVSQLMKDMVRTVECIEELYTDIVGRFLRVYLNEVRKKFLQSVRKEKKKAHRKEVMGKKTAPAARSIPPTTHQEITDEKLTMKYIEADQSVKKISSHNRLKEAVAKKKKIFESKDFPKASLFMLCEAYEVPTSKRDTKKILGDKLAIKIGLCTQMPNPSSVGYAAEHDEAGDADQTECALCKIPYGQNDTEDWIGCDICQNWFHVKCSNISDDYWDVVKEDDDAEWACDSCTTE